MPTYFLSCDWGTTNFRLRLVAHDDNKPRVLHEVETEEGVKDLAAAWKEKDIADEAARKTFYTDVLRRAAGELKVQAPIDFDSLPIVISGMASSNLGLANLPYQKLPVSTDGSGFHTETFPATDAFPHPILLISGLRTDDDVMRGEETQLIGCLTPEMKEHSGEQLVIHPGTHAKHITVQAGRITAFRTFMTGETFKLYSTYSVLAGSVEEGPLDAAAMPHFEAGVQASQNEPLLHALFSVRTADLFARRNKRENLHYLSGLLIGAELGTLRTDDGVRKYLCAGPSLHTLYTAALRVLRLDEKIESLPPEWEEGSVVRGQAMVLAKHELS